MRYFALPSWGMAYSIHDHISYILEASSKRSNDFSLIGRQPNETWQFKWKKLTVLKFKSKLNSKFILKRGKTIKIMKRSKNRRGITQVKTLFFTYKQKLSTYYGNKEIHAKKYCFCLGCTLWASYWHEHIQCKINWERTFSVFITEPFIEKFLFGIH